MFDQVFFCSWPLTISPRSKSTLAWWGTRLIISSNHHLYHSEYDHHNRHGHHPHSRHDCQVREEARLPAVSSAVLYEIFPFIMVIIVSFFFMIMNIFITKLITSSHDKNPRCLGRTWSSKVSDDPSHRFSQISQARFFPSQFQQSTGFSSEAGNLSSSFHNSFSQTLPRNRIQIGNSTISSIFMVIILSWSENEWVLRHCAAPGWVPV